MAAGHSPAHWSSTEWYSLAHVLIIVGIAVYFGKTAIRAALEGRRDGVKKKLLETREQLAALQKEIKSSREKVKNIEAEKRDLIARVEAEGRRLSEKLVADAEKTAERILSDARLAAQSEVESYRSRLRQDVVDAAMAKTLEALVSDQKAGGELSKKLHGQLVDKFVREASRVFHV